MVPMVDTQGFFDRQNYEQGLYKRRKFENFWLGASASFHTQ